MIWFEDLELLRYHSGPFDAENWSVPLQAIGWLEASSRFDRGACPDSVFARLKTLVGQSRSAHPHYYFRGGMTCSFCTAAGIESPGPVWSQENIFVPGSGVVYVAPGGIVHYVEAHGYLPPAEFIEAVLRCPDLESEEYCRALFEANGNKEPPLESKEVNERRWLETKARIARLRGFGQGQ
jgi:hypothetical protein